MGYDVLIFFCVFFFGEIEFGSIFPDFSPKSMQFLGKNWGKFHQIQFLQKKRPRKKSIHHTPCFFGCWIRFCSPFFPILYPSSVNYDSKCGFFSNFTEIWDFDPPLSRNLMEWAKTKVIFGFSTKKYPEKDIVVKRAIWLLTCELIVWFL